MVQPKDASLKFISKKHLRDLFDLLNVHFNLELDFSDVEVLTTEDVVIEPSLTRPDYIVRIGNIIFMVEFESSHVGTKKKKLFKLYISAFDYKNNLDNDKIIFFVISTKEKSKTASYELNDWDSFNFPIISLKDLDLEKIINNVETKIENNDEFSDRELLELGLTPLLGGDKEGIVNQFWQTRDILSKVTFPNEEIKNSVYGLVLMLSSMYFDELDLLRKDIQGDLMGKVDCVMEACQESFEKGKSEGISQGFSQGVNDVKDALKMLAMGKLSLEEISEITCLALDDVVFLKNRL